MRENDASISRNNTSWLAAANGADQLIPNFLVGAQDLEVGRTGHCGTLLEGFAAHRQLIVELGVRTLGHGATAGYPVGFILGNAVHAIIRVVQITRAIELNVMVMCPGGRIHRW